MFGLTPQEHGYIYATVVEPLTRLGARVYCFGSRARGDHQPFSDLDLMVEADQELGATIGALQEVLSNSNFPYKVDLVEFCHFAEAYQGGYRHERVPFLSLESIA